ncbi:hypothetical protein MXD59_04655 [Frankia sp. Ag45/Mut15]|uniref:Uncharacterized protein n=1 Tax=Frankia umida TaxID=573489 RepID=A0ABT0JUL0_9ACTN|nr:hypothetical protein [Frankia umida]MCK9875080.1 hypothetical protein [Frankia umida]
MSLTPPVLLLALAFPLVVMAAMLTMSGIERRLVNPRPAAARPGEASAAVGSSRSADGSTSTGDTPAVGDESPDRSARPALAGPFHLDAAPTTPLRRPRPAMAAPALALPSMAGAAMTGPTVTAASAAMTGPTPMGSPALPR